MEIVVPFFGKLRTNTPALALFMIGFIPLLYPVEKLKTEFLHVQQDVKSNVHPVLVYAVVNSKSIPSGVGRLDLSIPVLTTEDYSPELIYVAGTITDNQELDLKKLTKGIITLEQKTIQGKNVDVKEDIVEVPDRFK